MRRRMRYSFVIIKVAEYDIKDMFLLIFLTAIAHNANCEIDVFESVQNRQFVTPQKMPTIYRNLLFLKEDCGEVCDTSDNFVKKPGKYFDVIKKEFECDFLLESSSMYQKLILDEQMIKELGELTPPRFIIPAICNYCFCKRCNK